MSSPEKGSYVIPTEKNQDLINKAKALNHVPWCENYEKMISGMRMRFYGTPELEARYLLTLRLCRQYNDSAIPENTILTSLMDASREKLAAIVGHLGEHSYARAPFSASIGCNICIGDDVAINGDFRAADIGLVTIKDRTLIASSCRIETLNHSLNYLDRRRPDATARPVEIGEDCWVGVRVTILPGVTIGKGCIVAAGAVVTKDVAPFNLVGGVPAKVIRHLGNPEEAARNQGDKSDSIVSGDSGSSGSISVEQGEVSSQEVNKSEEGLPGGDDIEEIDKSEPDLPRWSRAPLGFD